MDKTTKSYIDSLLKPLLIRIQSLQASNESLRAQVRHLQQLVSPQPSYQKPTLSTSQQMRESRVSSKGSQNKKLGWNNNPKFQSPSKPIVNDASHQKIKTKPPIPKLLKSPGKQDHQEIKKIDSQKKINGGARFLADKIEQKPFQADRQHTKEIQGKREITKIQNSFTQNQNYMAGVQPFSKFQKLAKLNNELVEDMKHRAEKAAQQNPTPKYVQETVAPKSEYNRSQTTSPNSQSFISQSCVKKDVEGLKVNIECEQAKIELK